MPPDGRFHGNHTIYAVGIHSLVVRRREGLVHVGRSDGLFGIVRRVMTVLLAEPPPVPA